jgi:hypothetical protein
LIITLHIVWYVVGDVKVIKFFIINAINHIE